MGLLVAASGCLGNHFAADGASDGANGGGGTEGAGGFVAPSGAVQESTGLRRLTRTEYANTVRDLLATQLPIADQLAVDDVTGNYDNNAAASTMSSTRLQRFQTAAEALADELAASPNQLAKLAPCADQNQADGCLQRFVKSFGQKAWRRPLAEAEATAVMTQANRDSAGPYAQQVRQATTLLLMSPYFLYKVELGGAAPTLGPYELATRLAYFLWKTTPDATLLAAAADGSLLTDEGLRQQVERMRQDPKMATFASDFAVQWLGLGTLDTFVPDPTLFASYSAAVRTAAVAQTQASVAAMVQGDLTLGELYNGNQTYLNDELAAFYGLPAPGSSEMVRVDAGSRRGLLTHAAVLSATSSATSTSIILRGKYVMVRLQCASLGAPPAVIGSLEGGDGVRTTQRQRVEAIEARAACAVCHKQMDPYGYVLEPFDATGALRSLDNGQPIDPSAVLPDGSKIADVQEMSAYLASDPRTSNCFVQQLMTYALGRQLVASDAAQINALAASFVTGGQRVDQLVENIVLSPLFRQRADGV